jgi:hypothetical protein
MPSTASATPSFCSDLSRADRLDALGAEGRLEAYEHGELARADLWVWAARFPEEPPTVNGEFTWIACTLADRD